MKKLPFILFFFLFSCLSLMAQDVTDSIGDSGIPKAFIGINAGSGYFYAPHYSSTVGCAGFDVSFRVKDSLAIGFYVTYRSMNNLNLGLLFLIGNLNKNSFLLGFGPNFAFKRTLNNLQEGTITYDRHIKTNYGGDLKLGARHYGFYWYVNMNVSYLQGEDYAENAVYRWNEVGYMGTLNIGWMFGIRKKSNKTTNETL